MSQPPGYVDTVHPDYVYKLHKAIMVLNRHLGPGLIVLILNSFTLVSMPLL